MAKKCLNCEKEIYVENGQVSHECFFECVVCGKLEGFNGEEMAVCKVCRLQEETERDREIEKGEKQDNENLPKM